MKSCDDKLERLLRYHRRFVFDALTGDQHARAIRRLKRTVTARRESIRKGEMLTRMGY